LDTFVSADLRVFTGAPLFDFSDLIRVGIPTVFWVIRAFFALFAVFPGTFWYLASMQIFSLFSQGPPLPLSVTGWDCGAVVVGVLVILFSPLSFSSPSVFFFFFFPLL